MLLVWLIVDMIAPCHPRALDHRDLLYVVVAVCHCMGSLDPLIALTELLCAMAAGGGNGGVALLSCHFVIMHC